MTKLKDNKVLNNVLARPFQHKVKMMKNKRIPKKIRKYIQANLFTKKQKEVLKVFEKEDMQTLIHDGGTGSGKTYINNYIFLQALKRVRKEADETMGKNYVPQVILAAYKRENIKNNILNPLENDYGITVKTNQDNNFTLFGVEVITTFTNNRRGEEAIRGMTAWFAYVNEATLANKKTFEEIQKRLRGGDKPFLIADTNPDNPYHWLKTEYVDRAYQLGDEIDLEAEKEDKKVRGLYRVHSSPADNPYNGEGYLRRLYGMAEGPSKQRALGFWVSGQGAVYKAFNPQTQYISREELPQLEDFREFVVGVDWGFSPDPTVFLVFGVLERWDEIRKETEDVYYLIEEISAKDKLFEYWENESKKIIKKYGKRTKFYADPSGNEKIKRLRIVSKANVVKALNAREEGVERVNEVITDDRLFVVEENTKDFKREIGSYGYNEKNGELQNDDDHSMDAMRYALYTHIKKGQPFRRY